MTQNNVGKYCVARNIKTKKEQTQIYKPEKRLNTLIPSIHRQFLLKELTIIAYEFLYLIFPAIHFNGTISLLLERLS